MFDGSIIIAGKEYKSQKVFYGINPRNGKNLETAFSEASLDDVTKACNAAEKAFNEYSHTKPEKIAEFLNLIADNIDTSKDELVAQANLETALPPERLSGESKRTSNQLRLFAKRITQDNYPKVIIDKADDNRTPAPKPELILKYIAVGPVAVFGASNFPLAFSVAGGDTASALAAGCPVIVRGHPAHPGTGEIVARIITAAVKDCGLDAGVFSYLPGSDHEVGQALVKNSNVKSVAFTGSRRGGLALLNAANSRPEPIPVFAEMSSINPVFLLPNALKDKAGDLGTGFALSLTSGTGQFCTNPGIIVAVKSPKLEEFKKAAAEKLATISTHSMLTPNICKAYEKGIAELSSQTEVTVIGKGDKPQAGGAQAIFFATNAKAFMQNHTLSNEIFGASSVLIECDDIEEMLKLAKSFEGQLTATVQYSDGDSELINSLMPILERKVGRILFNGWPTGVEVSQGMVHGGPFPATTDGRFTSVGTEAIKRFLRPICFQNLPQGIEI